MAQELAIGVITGFGSDPLQAMQHVVGLGVPTVQVGYPETLDNEQGVASIKAALAATGIEITTVFCGFAGESYADIPTVSATVGLVPPSTRAARVAKTKVIAAFAQKLGVKRVAAHIGYVAEDPADPEYEPMVAVLQDICDDLVKRGQIYALETGQETAPTLSRFIADVARDNLKVNFDPANMILYGNDNPLEALDLLMPWVDGVHAKDGTWPKQKGEFGHETPLGEGDVNIPAFIEKLIRHGYRGPITIEREISGEQQERDIVKGRQLLEGLIAENLGR